MNPESSASELKQDLSHCNVCPHLTLELGHFFVTFGGATAVG